MPTLRTTDVQVWNQNGDDATLLHPYFDAMSLAVGVEISADLIANLDTEYRVDFQIIDGVTNTMAVNAFQTYKLPESWPAWWFSVGNNWGPNTTDYTTAERWGLGWLPPYVFGLRAVITAARWTGTRFDIIDAFDVSAVRWFQLRPVVRTD